MARALCDGGLCIVFWCESASGLGRPVWPLEQRMRVKTIRFVEAFAEALGESPQSMWPITSGPPTSVSSGARGEGRSDRGGQFSFVPQILGGSPRLPHRARGDSGERSRSQSEGIGRSRERGGFSAPAVLYFHLEHLSADPVSSVARFFARSFLICAWLAIRVQDMERTNLFADERDPNRVVRGVVRLSKNGEPINLFMPASPVWGLGVGGRGSCLKFVFKHCLSSLGHLFVLLGPGAGSVRQRPSGKKASQPCCPPKQGKEYTFKREVKLC
eukprot:scaffold3683_cov118-Isochrysis_galbana.AAC.1